MYKEREMLKGSCKTVYALNTWTDELKQQARDYLEQGYWVSFGAYCIGHTRAEITEHDGLEWAKEEFAGILEIARRKGYGEIYCRLI